MQTLDQKTKEEIFQALAAFYQAFDSCSLDKLRSILHPEVKLLAPSGQELIQHQVAVGEALYQMAKLGKDAFKMESQTPRTWSFNDEVLVEDTVNIYTRSSEGPTFYAQTNATYIFSKIEDQYLLSYLNVKLPDINTPATKAPDFQQIQKENLALRAALKNRTQELEQKKQAALLEAALERVRSRTMSLRESSQLGEVIQLVFQELKKLGLDAKACDLVILNEESKASTFWVSGEGIDEHTADELMRIEVPPLSHHHYQASIQNWEAGTAIRKTQLIGADCHSYMRELIENSTFNDMPLAVKDMLLGLDFIIHTEAYFQYGFFRMAATEELPNEHILTLQRFAIVFEQSYTRFLDLQKAEKQAREAQIEVALERIRSRTMAMQNSKGLAEVASVLFQGIISLGGEFSASGICLCNLDNPIDELWMSNSDAVMLPSIQFPHAKDPTHQAMYDAWRNGQETFIAYKEGTELEQHYENMLSEPSFREELEVAMELGFKIPQEQYWQTANYEHGYLIIVSETAYPFTNVLPRFAKVFEQAYTRFLDLQKAEEQAREAQIEVALERIRSKSMEIRSSHELKDVVNTIFQELKNLGVQTASTDVEIYFFDEPTATGHLWGAEDNLSSNFSNNLSLPLLEHPTLKHSFKKWKTTSVENRKHLFIVNDLSGAELEGMIQYIESIPHLVEAAQLFRAAGIQRWLEYSALFAHGVISLQGPEPVSIEIQEILRRFAHVFEQSYTRFLDLQKAEAQAREAQIEVALERVRARGMAMRESKELADTAQVLFQQLEILKIETWAAGFNIWEKNTHFSMSWMSLLGQLHDSFRMPHDEDPSFVRIYQQGKAGASIYVEALGGEDLQKHYQYIFSLQEGAQQITEELIASGVEVPEFPTYQVFNAAYFKYGYLMFITYEVNSEHEEIFQRFAQVFEQSYVRFLDLKRAEEQADAIQKEKNRLENTLKDLQDTQQQLIQQEKLASLGQLTAGIAHEIKNPLNFVNNFSELSIELLEEVFEELAAIPSSDAKTEILEVLSDVKSNLQKIHQHGSRADGIVQSMLLHSRGGSGEKAPCDLNQLLQEYSNLAFHGMRAGEQPINLKTKLNLDPNLVPIELIQEDFSRVILNLCNNAFDAMRSKLESTTEDYEPQLSISSRKTEQGIQIEIQDNGPGIPEAIQEKILQPFFTTKKGTAGTGLGLSISNDIIKAHGGSLEVQSKAGEGTTFFINLRA